MPEGNHDVFRQKESGGLMQDFAEFMSEQPGVPPELLGAGNVTLLDKKTPEKADPDAKANKIFLGIEAVYGGFNVQIIGNPGKWFSSPARLAEFVTVTGTNWGEMAAVATISMLPALVFLIFVQRYIVMGLTFGAVKE